MKLQDYKISLIKETIKKTVDSHDTLYGAFCKGIRFAEENKWINPLDVEPEEFEDLLDGEDKTKSVLVRFKSGRYEMKTRQNINGLWVWLPKEKTDEDKIIRWTNV